MELDRLELAILLAVNSDPGLTVLTLERNFQEKKEGRSRFQPYLTGGLRSLLIFLRVPTVTLASGSVAGGVSLSASNSFC